MPTVKKNIHLYYVTMTDKFMSGWGKAKGKTNKLIFLARSYAEAKNVYDNAKNQGSMKYINIVYNRPKYNPKTTFAQHKSKKSSPNWYKKGWFKKEK